MKKSRLFMVVGAIAVFISSTFSCTYIRWQWMTMEEKADFIKEKLSDRLELNKEQEALLNRITVETVKKIKSQKPLRIQIHRDFIRLLKSDFIDGRELRELSLKSHDLNKGLREFSIERFVELHRMLNKQQRQKLIEIMDESFEDFYKE